MTKVITYGTYDLLHQGHINLLKRAKTLGDYLIVGVTNDSFDRERGKLNTDESKEYSQKAVETIMKWWREYIIENTEEAAVHIMEASNYAGRAINITQTTAPHAFSYKLTAMYGLPHGHAVAICLPVIWGYMLGNMDKCIDRRGAEYLQSIFGLISKSMRHSTPMEAIETFRTMMVEMGMQNSVSGNRDEDVEILSRSVNPVRLNNNPVCLEMDSIVSIFTQVVREID